MNLILKNFQSFSGEHKIFLNDAEQYLLHGINTDEGGSNGSGKTSLMTAIALAFTGDTPKNITKKELPYSGESDFEVGLEYGDFSSSFGDCVIINGQKMGKSKFNQDFQSQLGFTKDQFNTICYIYQNSSNRFLDLPDSEKKDFLFPLMNWDCIFTALDQISEDRKGLPDIKSLEEEVQGHLAQKQTIEAQLEETLLRSQSSLGALAKDVEIAKKEFQTINAAVTEKKQQLQQLKVNLANKLRNDKIKLDELKGQLQKLELKKQELNKIRMNISNLSSNIKALQTPNSKCPTCGSLNHKDNSKAIEDCLSFLKEQEFASTQLAKELEIEPELKQAFIDKEVALKVEISNGTKQAESELLGMEQLLLQLQKNYQNTENHYKAQELSFKRELDLLNSNLKTITSRIDTTNKKIIDAKQKEADLAELCEVIKKVQSVAIDMAMKDLIDRANIWLNAMSAGALSIDFETSKVQGNKKVVQKIVPIINHKIRGLISVGSLSGGEYAKCRLAVDMALHEAISLRIPAIPKILMLDEVTHDIDADGKIAFYGLINQRLNDRLLLIAEHHEEIRGMFKNIIVEKRDGRTQVING